MARQPTIHKAGFAEGAGWLIGGGELLARGGRDLMRVAVVLLLIALVQIIPMIGPLVLLLISPALTAGMLNVFETIERGGRPGANGVLAGLRDPGRREPLLMLGVLFLVGVFVAIGSLVAWVAPQVDLQALSEFLDNPEAVNNNPARLFEFFEGANALGGLVIATAIIAVVLGGLYFAVPLVFFWRWPIAAALLWSLRALLVNWLAFLGFGLLVTGVLLLAGLVFAMVGGIIGLALGPAGVFISQLLAMAFSLFVQLLIAAAQWRSFVSVFPAGEGRDDDPDDTLEV